MTEKRIQKLKRKLQEARYAAIQRNPAFAFPLLEKLYVAVSDVSRMSTNGGCIYVNPNWLQSISMTALEFMLAHQQMHITWDILNGHSFSPESVTILPVISLQTPILRIWAMYMTSSLASANCIAKPFIPLPRGRRWNLNRRSDGFLLIRIP